MTTVQLAALALTAVTGPVLVATRDVLRLPVVLSLYGMALTVLFLAFQAPDVALSQIAVGSVILPFLLLVTLGKIQGPDE